MRKKISDEVRTKIIEDIKSGMTQRSAARKNNVSESAVNSIWRRQGEQKTVTKQDVPTGVKVKQDVLIHQPSYELKLNNIGTGIRKIEVDLASFKDVSFRVWR